MAFSLGMLLIPAKAKWFAVAASGRSRASDESQKVDRRFFGRIDTETRSRPASLQFERVSTCIPFSGLDPVTADFSLMGSKVFPLASRRETDKYGGLNIRLAPVAGQEILFRTQLVSALLSPGTRWGLKEDRPLVLRFRRFAPSRPRLDRISFPALPWDLTCSWPGFYTTERSSCACKQLIENSERRWARDFGWGQGGFLADYHDHLVNAAARCFS